MAVRGKEEVPQKLRSCVESSGYLGQTNGNLANEIKLHSLLPSSSAFASSSLPFPSSFFPLLSGFGSGVVASSVASEVAGVVASLTVNIVGICFKVLSLAALPASLLV